MRTKERWDGVWVEHFGKTSGKNRESAEEECSRMAATAATFYLTDNFGKEQHRQQAEPSADRGRKV